MLDTSLVLKKVEEVFESHIRPAIQMDGGDISIVSLEDNILTVRLHGMCAHCPRSFETLKFGVERTLQSLVDPHIMVTVSDN